MPKFKALKNFYFYSIIIIVWCLFHFFFIDIKGVMRHLCMLQYYFDGPVVSVTPKPHGLSKHSQPYYRTPKSTMDKLKKVSTESMPKAALNKLVADEGGEIESKRPTKLPRNRQQLSNLRRSTNVRDSNVLYTILLECKLAQGSVDAYIRDVKAAPNPQCILFFDWQIKEMIKFLTNPFCFGVFNVDTTFNLGQFYVTTTSYPHYMLESIRTTKPPHIIGPVLVHQKVDFSSFNYFAGTLVSQDRRLRNIMAFGTDGDKALIEAFGHNFAHAIQLRCFIHSRKNIHEKLRSLGIDAPVANDFLADIYGRQVGTVKEEGLVDSVSEQDFDQRLEGLQKVWDEREKPFCTESGPKFYEYFQTYHAPVVKHNMCRHTRECAGLGCPPAIFTTNSVESVNALLKQKVNFKESEWPTFNSKLKELVDSQRQEVIRSVTGRGEYRLISKFQHLSVSVQEWTRMRTDQRKSVVSAFDDTALNYGKGAQGKSSQSVPNLYNTPQALSISADDSGIATLPIVLLQSIWKKASDLIANPKAITPAPGDNEKSCMVLSYSSSMPHLVQHKGKGHFVCDSACLQWKSSAICSHTLACAEAVGNLSEFLIWFNASSSAPNITSVAMDGLSSGRGKKKGQQKRKRGKQLPPVQATYAKNPATPSTTLPSQSVSVAMSLPCGASLSTCTPSQSLPVAAQFSSTPSPQLPSTPRPVATQLPSATVTSQLGHSTTAGSSLVYNWQPYVVGPVHLSTPQQSQSASPTSNPFYLKLIQGNIRMCQGCRNSLRAADGTILPPPHDIAIARAERRSFRDSSGNLITPKRETVCHYHCALLCVMKADPSFTPINLYIPSDIKPKLSQVHLQYLQAYLGVLV